MVELLTYILSGPKEFIGTLFLIMYVAMILTFIINAAKGKFK